MKKSLSTVAALALLLTAIRATSGLLRAQAPSAASPKGIAGSLQPFIDSHTLAGAVTLAASKDKVLSLEVVGYADVAAQKPMRTDNLFWIASMSKSITATALMMLVDEGKVNVDDPVEKYLPEFKGQMLRVEQEKGKVVLKNPGHPITVKNLLTHTSGLVNEPAAGQRWDTTSLRAAVQCYAARPLKFEPGSKFEYNNPGINTVGRIIEVVSRLPYEEFMAKRLFEPLGMKDTTFWPTDSQIRRLAKTYKPNADKTGLEAAPTLPFVDSHTGRKSMPFPAGGLFSTATDVSLFCRMILSGGILNGKRYLSEKAIQQMTSTQTGNLPVAYGFGWFTDRKPGGPCGHGGAHKTDMHIYPQQQLITVLMVQHTDWGNDDGKKILPTFQQAAIKAFAVVPPAQPTATPTTQAEGQPASVLPNLNKLTGAEKTAGWKLLFDGKTTTGWRNFRKQTISNGWQVIDGALRRVDKSAGDIITTEQFDNFVLELDYKVPPHANSGIMYRVSEDEARAPLTGVECQILDNTDPKGDPQKSGWAYALYQPPPDAKSGKPLDATRPVGRWNHIRLVCTGSHVEHWMNGVKYCEYEIGSADWNQRVANSKFAKWPKFAQYKVGHIALQGDHGDVCFANIKLLPLPAK
jgi:CubicO group peptidase (beta-lactamase class C family)